MAHESTVVPLIKLNRWFCALLLLALMLYLARQLEVHWNPWQQTARLFGHARQLTDMVFAPGERELITAGVQDIAVWDVESGRELRRISRAFPSSESNRLIADAEDIYEWKIQSGHETTLENWKPAVPEAVKQINFSPRETLSDAAKRVSQALKIEIAISSTLDGGQQSEFENASGWSRNKGDHPLDYLTSVYHLHVHPVHGVITLLTREELTDYLDRETLTLFSVYKQRPVQHVDVTGLSWYPSPMLDPSGKWVLLFNENNMPVLFDRATQQRMLVTLDPLVIERDSRPRCEFSGDGRRMMVVCKEGWYIWDCVKNRPQFSAPKSGSPMSLSYDGHSVIGTSSDESPRIWDADTGETLWSLPARQEHTDTQWIFPKERDSVLIAQNSTMHYIEFAPGDPRVWSNPIPLSAYDNPYSLERASLQKGRVITLWSPEQQTQFDAKTGEVLLETTIPPRRFSPYEWLSYPLGVLANPFDESPKRHIDIINAASTRIFGESFAGNGEIHMYSVVRPLAWWGAAWLWESWALLGGMVAFVVLWKTRPKAPMITTEAVRVRESWFTRALRARPRFTLRTLMLGLLLFVSFVSFLYRSVPWSEPRGLSGVTNDTLRAFKALEGERILTVDGTAATVWSAIDGQKLSQQPIATTPATRFHSYQNGLFTLSAELNGYEALAGWVGKSNPNALKVIPPHLEAKTTLRDCVADLRNRTGANLEFGPYVNMNAPLGDGLGGEKYPAIFMMGYLAQDTGNEFRVIGDRLLFLRGDFGESSLDLATVTLRDVETGRELKRFSAPHIGPNALAKAACALTPDCETAAILSHGVVTVISGRHAEPRCHLTQKNITGEPENAIGISDDGHRVLAVTHGWEVFDADSGMVLARNKPQDRVTCTLSPSGRFVLETRMPDDSLLSRTALWAVDGARKIWEYPVQAANVQFNEAHNRVLFSDVEYTGSCSYALPLREHTVNECRRSFLEYSRSSAFFSADGSRVLHCRERFSEVRMLDWETNQVLYGGETRHEIIPLLWYRLQQIAPSLEHLQYTSVFAEEYSADRNATLFVMRNKSSAEAEQALFYTRQFRPEQWWGVAWMPEAWLLALTALMLLVDGIEVWAWRQVGVALTRAGAWGKVLRTLFISAKEPPHATRQFRNSRSGTSGSADR